LEGELGLSATPPENVARRMSEREALTTFKRWAAPVRCVAPELLTLETGGALTEHGDRSCRVLVRRQAFEPAPELFDLLRAREVVRIGWIVVERKSFRLVFNEPCRCPVIEVVLEQHRQPCRGPLGVRFAQPAVLDADTALWTVVRPVHVVVVSDHEHVFCLHHAAHETGE